MSSYRLGSRGTGFIGGPYSRIPLGRSLHWHFALQMMFDSRRYEFEIPPFERYENTIALLPEVGIEATKALGSLSPFAGAGAGLAFVLNGPARSGITLHAVAGARLRVSERTSLSGSIVARTVRPFSGRMFDFLLGIDVKRRPRKTAK